MHDIVIVAARSWMAPGKAAFSGDVAIAEAGSPGVGGSRDLPGARSMPRG